ncbi:MAG: hypothetical protein IPN03_17230 [Holophagales bacterium]|nr:hypothetical protein [Holophagales bacterium]
MTIPLRKPAPFVLLALFVVAALMPAAIAAWGRDYWRPDEPDYAQHTREMVQRGDYVVPYQNGVPFPEKPILTYWAAAATTPFTGATSRRSEAAFPRSSGRSSSSSSP